MIHKKIILSTLLFLVIGCQTGQKFDSQKTQGQWEAKAQIKDLKNNKQHLVGLDMIAMWPESLRTEVTGPLGISLASLVLKNQQIAYLLPQQKKYYYGAIGEGSLAPLFTIDFNPKYLVNLCFDQPITEKGWNCSVNAAGLAEKCVRKNDQLTIVWKERDGEQKRVFIQRADFEIQVLFKKYKPLVQIPEAAFTLKPPDDFRRYKLQ